MQMRRSFLPPILLSAALWLSFSALEANAGDAQNKVAHVGYVDPDTRANARWGWPAFWKRMRELGWIEGQNLVVEARWADGRIDKLPELMAEVIEHKVDVIFTYHTTGAVAARNATSTIPIVFAGVSDPVASGLVASLAHAGGNLTGLSSAYDEGWGAKWLELLQETVPHLSVVAVIASPDDPYLRVRARQLESAASARGMKLKFFHVRQPDELDSAFDQARRQAQAVVTLPDPFTYAHRARILALAYKHGLPDMYALQENVELGGLMAYGVNSPAMWRRAAEYVDSILKGAKPQDLPIERSTQFLLTLNLKRAKALGLTIPESILVRADEVIR
jgi:putative tryptophan/tyrosine transport system substrate-binding protein